MADSDDCGSPCSSNGPENAENDLQPFFVLHKGRKLGTSSSKAKKTRRKIAWPPICNGREASEDDDNASFYQELRFEAFESVWGKIEAGIREVLTRINANLFEEIHDWVNKSFAAIKASFSCSLSEVISPFPVLTNNICRQLFTAFVFTKNVEFVDDLLTFKELGQHLKSRQCHVANLSSLDFSVKNGIGGCIRSLLRQLVTVTSTVADISILTSWYGEPANYDRPIVVIIEEMEQCVGVVLAEFIAMLSEYVGKLPLILLMGVATTDDAPSKLLPATALQHLQPCKFAMGSPIQRMDAVIKFLLENPFCGFGVGYEVILFLKNYFFKHDATVASFLRALKIACAKHFCLEPLSFLCKGATDENCQEFWNRACNALPQDMLDYASSLPSSSSASVTKGNPNQMVGDILPIRLAELTILWNNWSSVVMCLYEVGLFCNLQLLDIYCEALDPSSSKTKGYRHQGETMKSQGPALSHDQSDHVNLHRISDTTKGAIIPQIICRIRDLPAASLSQLLEMWEKYTKDLHEIHEAVQALLKRFRADDDGKQLKQQKEASDRLVSQRMLHGKGSRRTLNEEVAMLAELMIRDFLIPMESAPFHEIFCFKDVGLLQSALIGDPRKTIQEDLLKCQVRLNCSCCEKGLGDLSPSMHDTAILYILSQEHGDLINVYDWYQSFRTMFINSLGVSKKSGAQKSPTPKKRKAVNMLNASDEASIQARFCRAISELQVTGLLRMPSKRRPDYVQRIAIGL
ncbi:Origin of replication complex subunit 3 [Nymphaea thermarum]|nr:Origin of replication complex subunit 3 [Nymphaea thermarum]